MRGRRVSDRRKLVDQVLEADKRLVGRGAWRPDGPHGKQRLLLPIEVEGELSGTELQIKSYPNAPSLRFRILLIVGKCVWRLDYVDDDNHINPANRPPETPAGPIREPHYHAWLDNKRFAKHNSLPDELKVARLLSPRIRRFDQAFRWFCSETGLRFSEADMPTLPERDRLL